jgi:phytoene/squalene synthetase
MADGMVWSTETLAAQGGVLADRDQVARYCHAVIGNPALFVLRLVTGREPSPAVRREVLRVSEMIQLANVTRDIERDLTRGVAYHPALRPFLGDDDGDPAREATIRSVRLEHLRHALRQAPAFRNLFEDAGLESSAATRCAAILMLLFTDLHYREVAARVGHRPWPGPGGPLRVAARAIPATVSSRWSRRTVERVEARFLEAARGLHPDPRGSA